MDAQAKKLNELLRRDSPEIYSMLSDLGKIESFPKAGIPGQTTEAKGTRINATIGQAFNDDGSPMVLPLMVELAKDISSKDLLYSPNFGQKALREEWRKHIKEKNPSLTSRISLPVVTSGLTNGLKIVGSLFLGKEERIVSPNLRWGNYARTFRQGNFSDFYAFNGDRFNVTGLKSQLKDRHKFVLLNFPNNPTGYSPSENEAEHIAEMLVDSAEKGNRHVVVCDDAYFGLVYEEGVEKESLFAKLADAHEGILAVKIDGATKELYNWGARVGFVTYGTKGLTEDAAMVLEDKTAGAVRGDISNVCTTSQATVLKALQHPDLEAQLQNNYNKLRERYDAVVESILDPNHEEFFEPVPFNSGYFMCVRMKQHDPNEIRRKLIDDFSTGLIATGDMIRVAYSTVGRDVIPELFDNLHQACVTAPRK